MKRLLLVPGFTVFVLVLAATGLVDTRQNARAPWPAGDQLFGYRGNLANIRDSRGWTIWTPSLPGADDEVLTEWMGLLRDHGTTHIPFGPAEAGPAYASGDGARTPAATDNPDSWADLPRFRRLVERVLSTPSADGIGFRPVLFIGHDDWSEAELTRRWTALAAALDGLEDHVIYVPAWEPVEGAWSAERMGRTLLLGRRLFGPASHWFVHLSPGRRSWMADRSARAWQPPYDFVEGLLYQTEHGAALYREPCTVAMGEACFLAQWDDVVRHVGAGEDGWPPVRELVFFESVAYEFFRERATEAQARRIATAAKVVADRHGVTVGYGNGLPEP